MPDDKDLLTRFKSGAGKLLSKATVEEARPETENTDVPVDVMKKFKAGNFKKVATVDVNEDNQAVSRNPNAPMSMQSVNSGMPAPEVHDALSVINKNFQQYLGKVPEGNVVEFQGKDEAGKPVTRTYDTHNPQPVTKEQSEIARGSIKKELDANAEFVAKDIENQFNSQSPYFREQMERVGLDKDKIAGQIVNPAGDKHALQAYAHNRLESLQQDYQNELAQIPKPQQRSVGPTSLAEIKAYDAQVAQVNKKYQEQRNAINNVSFNLAAQKVVNEQIAKGVSPEHINPYEVGADVERIIGDEKDVEADQDKWKRYGKFDPAKKVNREIVGYRALDVVRMAALADNNIPLADQLHAKTDNYQRKIVDNNPEFRKQQLVSLLSDEIYKGKNSLAQSITGYSPDEEDLKAAAKNLGIPEKDIADIKAEDLYRLPDVLTRVGKSFIGNSAAPLSELAFRHIVAPIHRAIAPDSAPTEGQIDNALPSDWYDNSNVGLFMGGKAPAASQMLGNGSRIENNSSSTNYLLDVSDDHKNWNINPGSVANALSDGIGQIASYAAGGKAIGAATQAANLATSAEMADRIGVSMYGYLTSYDRNKKSANQAIGASGSEADKVMLANIYSISEALSEQIFPDTKIADQIFNTSAGKELINTIRTQGVKALDKESVSSAFIKGAKEFLGNDLKEGAEEAVTVAGNALGDAIFAPKQYEQTDYQKQAVQQGIMGAVSAIIPTGVGAIAQTRRQGSVLNSVMYNVGENPTAYKEQVANDLGTGKITQVEADGKNAVIDKMAHIVNNEVPETSVINDNPLTAKQKNEYANNLLQESLLTDRIDNTKDEVQKGIIEAQVKDLKTQRQSILENAGGQAVKEALKTNNNETEEANKTEEAEVLNSEGQVQPTEAEPFADLSDWDVKPKNTVQNATQESSQQQQEISAAGNIIEHPGTQEQRIETALPEANSSNSDQRSQEKEITDIAPIKTILPVDYTTGNGRQKVTFSNGVLKVINPKTNEEVSAPTAKKATLEAAANYDFSQGERTQLPAGVSGNAIEEYVAENSNNPAELVDLYTNEEPVEQSLTGPEFAIAQFGAFTTTNKSYNRFGDRNNMVRHKAVNYINDQKGAGVDQIAKEITDNTGIEVTPEDVVSFMDRFPNGVKQALRTDISPIAQKAAARFQELTGFPLTPDITDEVYKQQSAKNDLITNDFLNKEYESEQQLESAYWDELAKALLNNEEEAGIVQSLKQSGQDVIGSTEEQPANTTGTTGASEETSGVNSEDAKSPGSGGGTEQLDERESKLFELRTQIDDIKSKLEKSEESRDLLLKKGVQTSSPEYQVKLKGAQQLQNKLKTAEKEFQKLTASAWADRLRSAKVPATNLLMSNPLQIPVAIYNAALELAATSLEKGVQLKAAIEDAIDFIKDRVRGHWDEKAMRDILGENQSSPITPEEIRVRKEKDTLLSDKQKGNADVIVDRIRNHKATLQEAETYINTHKDLTPSLKASLISYIRQTTTNDVYKANGMVEANKYLQQADGDYAEALRQMQDDYTVSDINDKDTRKGYNDRQTYIAAKTILEGRQVAENVTNGTVKPVSAIHTEESAKEGSFVLPEQKVISKRRQELTNRYERLEEAQKNSTVAITEQLDAVSGYRLMGEKAAHIVNKIKDYLGDSSKKKGSFFDRLYKAGIDLQDFGLYLYAKHAPERNAANAQTRQLIFDSRLFELNEKLANAQSEEAVNEAQNQIEELKQQKNPDYILMPDGGSGMTNKQAEEILSEIEKDGKTDAYEKFSSEFRENVIDKILDFKHKSRMLSDKEYDNLKNAYQHYVPLKFDLDEELGSDGKPSLAEIGKSGRDLFRTTGAAEVGAESRNNVVLQTLSDLDYSIFKGEENLANVRMANLIEANPNENIWKTVPARYKVFNDKEGNFVKAIEDKNMKPQGPGVIPYWVDGSKRYIVLNDRGLQDSFKKINPSLVMKGLQFTTAMVRNFATMKNVPFLIVNPIMDLQDAGVYIKGQDNPEFAKAYKNNVKKFFSVAKSVATGKGEWANVNEEREGVGGKVSFSKRETIEDKGRKSIKNFEAYREGWNWQKPAANYKTFKNIINDYAEVLEQTTRLIVYKSAIDAGMTKEQAAIKSREATVDFGKSGTLGPYINSWKAFANAGIQGLDSTWALRKSKAFAKLFGGMAVFGAAQAFFADMLGDCEHDPETCYWEMPEYRKQKSIVIATGKGAPLTIPLGRRLGWASYMGQNMYSLGKYIATDGEQGTSPGDFVKNSLSSLFDYYNPAGGTGPILQQVAGNAAPAVGMYGNENSFGQPIHPDNKQEKPKSESYFNNTPETYKDISHFLASHTGGGNGEKGIIEWSPNDIEFVMRSVFSGLYGWTAGIATTTANAINPDKDAQAKDMPLVNRIYRPSNLSVTKSKLADLTDDANDRILTDEDMATIERYMARLKENNELTEDQEERTMKYIDRSQKAVEKRKEEHEGDDQ